MRLLPCGPNAVMAEVDGVEQAAAMAAHLRAMAIDGVVEIVPAARTVLVWCEDVAHRRAVQRLLPTIELDRAPAPASVLVEVPTVYDGDDLDDVAAATGVAVADVIAMHSGAEYRAAFCGFAPGF